MGALFGPYFFSSAQHLAEEDNTSQMLGVVGLFQRR